MRTSMLIIFSGLLILGLIGWAMVGLIDWLAFPMPLLGPNRGLPGFVAPLPGLFLGLGLGALLPTVFTNLTTPGAVSAPPQGGQAEEADRAALSPLSIAVVVATAAAMAIAVLAGVRSGDLPVSRAILTLVCGALTLLVAIYAMEAIRTGEGLIVESHWGGLGGGLGGWRASASAVLVVLLLLLLGGTATLSLMTPDVVLALAAKPGSGEAAADKSTARHPAASETGSAMTAHSK
jgi:hypothetical protein